MESSPDSMSRWRPHNPTKEKTGVEETADAEDVEEKEIGEKYHTRRKRKGERQLPDSDRSF